MRRFLPFVALVAGCPSAPHFPETQPANACSVGAIQTGEQVLQLDVDGKMRQALVWMPEVEGPYTVLVNLHSFRSEPRRVAHYMKLVEWAKDKPVILVGADGKTATWNAGECCGKAAERGYDDVAFLDALVERIDAVSCTNGEVVVSGLGNGAMMAHRWACESDTPDALLTAGGTLQMESCARTTPLPVLHFHGDADEYAPLDGSGGHRPVEHGLAEWRRINGVTSPPTELSDGEMACSLWSGAQPVSYCQIAGGFNGWPGAADMPVNSVLPFADATTAGLDWVDRALHPVELAVPATPSAAVGADVEPVEAGGAAGATDEVQPALEAGVEHEEGAH